MGLEVNFTHDRVSGGAAAACEWGGGGGHGQGAAGGRECESAAGAHQSCVAPALESQPLAGGGHRGAHGVGHHRALLLLLRLGAPAAPPD